MEQSRSSVWAVSVALGIFTFLLYFNSLHGAFQYDDGRLIRFNFSLRGFEQWKQILLFEPARPVVSATYALNFQIGKKNPFSYHAMNLMLHMAVSITLFLLLLRLSKRLFYAGLSSWIFAAHTLNTEAVVYISSRSILLCALFTLLALFAFDQALRKGGRKASILSFLCFFLAGLSREDGWLFPVAAILYNGILFGQESIRKAWKFHLCTMILMIAAGLFRVYLELGYAGHKPFPFSVYHPTEVVVWFRYLGLALLPAFLNVDHYVSPLTWLQPVVWGAMAGALLLTFFFWRVRKEHPLASFWGLFFFLSLLPSSLIPLNEFMSEHRTYLSMLGFSALAGYLVVIFEAESRRIPRWITTALIVWIAFLSLATVLRNKVWATEANLWADAATKSPQKYRARVNFAFALFKMGRTDLALPEFILLRSQFPNQPGVHSGIGFCYLEMDRFPEAEESFRRSLELDPGFIDSKTGMGIALYKMENYPEALEYFQQVLPFRKESKELLEYMIDSHMKMGQYENVIPLAEQGARLDPSDPYWEEQKQAAEKNH